MIQLIGDTLRVSFPEIHPEATCELTFQRTLRIPDDGKAYPLPAGMGSFPLFDVANHPLPDEWRRRGGVFLPMHQSEAMWLHFSAHGDYPFAVKVAAGKINAVTGGTWCEEITASPQDYVVTPEQPWLDGFCVERGVVRQFVAASMGEGHTAEEQLTGNAEWGGLQFIFYPMKAEEYRVRFELPRLASEEINQMRAQLDEAIQGLDSPFARVEALLISHENRMAELGSLVAKHEGFVEWDSVQHQLNRYAKSRKQIEAVRDAWERGFCPYRRRHGGDPENGMSRVLFSRRRSVAEQCCDYGMGVAAGGMIKQEIAEDPYGLTAWDTAHQARCFVHLVNSRHFTAITGKRPPSAPITPSQYAAVGIPWFDYYADGPALPGSSLLAGLKPLSASMQAKGQSLPDNQSTTVGSTVDLSPKKPKQISEGVF